MNDVQLTGDVGEAFGHLASSYDQDFESLPAAQRLRGIVWEIYLRYFRRGDSLLELNCGTGTDALALAAHGIRIHATDISEGMLDAFNRKLAGSIQKEMITTQLVGFDHLQAIHDRQFDGVYSNMGGLNCEPDLPRVAHDLHELVKPGGIFIGTFLGHMAVWEMVAFLARGNIKDAFRRSRRRGVPAHIAGSLVTTYYYSPGDVAKHFAPYFVPVELAGLNIFTPPPTSVMAYRRLGSAMRLLEYMDDALMRTPPFKKMGDHFVLVLKHGGGA